MPDLVIDSRYTIPERELRVSTSRSGGPGGQHVNTTDTRVRLHYCLATSEAFPDPVRERLMTKLATRLTKTGDLVISAGNSRSQHDNLAEALDRLRQILVEALKVPRKRRKTKPSKGAVRRRLSSKKQRGDLKRSRRKPSRDD